MAVTQELILAGVVIVTMFLIVSCHCKRKRYEGLNVPGTSHPYSGSGTGLRWTNLDNRMNDLLELDDVDNVDYSGELVQEMALEPEVAESHSKYVTDSNRSTSGSAGAALTIRSDTNEVVKRVGLRMPNYRSMASPKPDARVTASEYPDQMYEQTHYMI